MSTVEFGDIHVILAHRCQEYFLLDIKYSCTYLVVHSQFWLNTCHFAKQVWEVE